MYIFDIDGTLLYTIDTISYFINESLKHFGLGEVPREKVRDFVGNGPVVLCESALDYVGAKKDKDFRDEFLNYYNKSYDDNPSHLTRPYDGIREVLDMFKKRGEILACFSNKPDETCKKVIGEIFGKDYFDYILGYKNTYERKPSAEGIAIIKDYFAVSFSDIIYFGDSEVDIKCGKNAGVFTVACSWGFRDRSILEENKPDLIIDKPEEMNIRRA